MAHKSYPRVARVNHLLQQVIADELELIDDDELGLVTITGCEVSVDLRHAKVFISALGGDEEKQRALEILAKYKGRIKRAMSASTRMKYLPDIHFHIDPSIDAGFEMDAIIKDIHNRGDSLALRDDDPFEDDE